MFGEWWERHWRKFSCFSEELDATHGEDEDRRINTRERNIGEDFMARFWDLCDWKLHYLLWWFAWV